MPACCPVVSLHRPIDKQTKGAPFQIGFITGPIFAWTMPALQWKIGRNSIRAGMVRPAAQLYG
jgi:hypothetical protein